MKKKSENIEKIKAIMGISSFSSIVGMTQPDMTCPMIDELISDYKFYIQNLNGEIATLEKEIRDLDDMDREKKIYKER